MVRPRGALWQAPTGADWALTALFAVPSVAQVLLDPIAPRPVGLAYALMSTGPLAWRRSHPAGAALTMSLAWLIPTPGGFLYLGFAVAAVLFFAVGRHDRRRTTTVLTPVVALGTGTLSVVRSGQPLWTLGTLALVVLAPLLAGRILSREEERTARLTELTGRLRDERDVVGRLAASEERARIAQEMHDVVGHDLTVIALQADAASAALRQDPARAARPIEIVGETARGALTEMRRVLLTLRDSSQAPTARADAAGVESLVARARELGDVVDLRVTGEPVTDERVSAAAYRIIQESLTNARRHGSGFPVVVEVDWSGVDLRIVNGCRPEDDRGAAGMGLAGMAERARLLGGHLSAEAVDGSFVVTAHLPVGQR